MEKDIFLKLCHILKEKYLLRNTWNVSVEEQLGIFLLTIGYNESNRVAQERFQHSGETISRYFNQVLRPIVVFSSELIKSPQRFDTPPEILNNNKYYPYFKVEELIREQSISYGYEWVELFCGCIKKNLSCIQKQRECPPESREAVASLIYATARFGDLPALRDLRLLFTKRYGNALASFDRSINREFVEVMSSKPVPLDKKLCLMREISREFYVDWDFRSFELKISNSHASPTETSASETSPEPTNPMNTRQLDKAKNPSSPSKNSEVGGHDDGFDHREQPIRSDEERLVESSLGHKETSYMRKKYQKQSVAVDGNKDSNTKGSSGGSGRRGSSKKSARDMRRIFAAPIEEEEQWDEEDDAVMDELLMYYSCKCSAYESLEARLEKKNNNKSCAASSSMSPQRGRKGGIRIPSSPPEQMNGADVVAKEPPDAHVALPEPGKLRPRVWHVHPKLPDCDNFAAKLAALRKEYEGKQSSYQA